MLSKTVSAAAETARETSGAASTSSKRNSRRLLFLGGFLLLAILVFIFVVAVPRWRDYRYAHATLDQLAGLCSHDDLRACSLLTRKTIAARSAEKAGPPLQAVLSHVKAGSVNVTNADKADLMGQLALVDMLSGQIDAAQPLFTMATQMDFNAEAAHLANGFWLSGQGQDAAALHELQIASTLEPSDDMAWFLTAHIYNQNNFLDKGRAAAQRAIALNSNFALHWEELGDSYAYAGKYDEALKAYQKELALDPKSPAAQADVARAFAFLVKTPEQYKEGVEKLQGVLNNNPINPVGAYTQLGDLHLQFGHAAEAVQAYQAALKLEGSIPETYYKLSRAQKLVGDAAASKQTMDQYKEMYNHYQTSRILQKKLSQTPSDVNLHLQMAKSWEYYQAWDQAAQEYLTTLRLRPNEPVATKRLEELKRLFQAGKANVPHSWVVERLLHTKPAGSQPNGAAPNAPADAPQQ